MGMDLNGKKPKNKTGEYFRNNCWWWRPLWDYCCIVSEEARSVKYGYSNDGDGLNSVRSRKLAATLLGQIENGAVKRYEKERQARLNALPDEECKFCHGTGKRTDMVVVNGCNACLGTGKVRPFEDMYGFSEENVKDFARFLQNCGGFEIW
jgi:hypothetical protein